MVQAPAGSNVGKDKTLQQGVGHCLRDDHRDLPALVRRGSDSSGPSGSRLNKADQVFIPVDAGRDASTGDEVLVKIVKRSKGPGFNPEGRVVQVVARASGLFVGHYYDGGGGVGYRPVIDGSTFSRSTVFVGDPGRQGSPGPATRSRWRWPDIPRRIGPGEKG